MIGLVVGVLIGGLLAYIVLTKLPFVDRGFRIFACKSERARDVLVKVLSEEGLKPSRRIDTSRVKRVLFNDNRTILNWTEPGLWEEMGKPASGIALVTSSPWGSANGAVMQLQENGFSATILGELDEDVPPGTMVFVRTDALVGSVLVFRRHVMKMGKPPPRW